MNLLDAAIVIVLILQAIRWVKYGFVRGGFSLIGFWAGILLGAILAPFVVTLAESPMSRMLIAILSVLLVATLTGELGRFIGKKLYSLVNKFKLGKLDSVLGSVFSVIVTLVVVWFLAAIFGNTAYAGLNRQIRDSSVLSAVNRVLPPAPDVLSRLGSLINPDSFPQVFIGQEPRPVAPVNPPSSEEIAAALDAAGESTVRLESAGCGGMITGSGFVAAPNVVVTNAHVVAGIDSPTVVDVNGQRSGEVIYFDSDLDMAVLRAGNLAGPPLNLSDQDFDRGTAAVALGYPGGGPLEAVSAGVLDQFNARGRNIYGQGVVNRPVYMLQTTIESGNSGGPVVLTDGTVIGMVFARSQTEDNIGYGIRSGEITNRLNQAISRGQPVSTGSCTPR